MKFTDRFIKLPITLFHKNEVEIMGQDSSTPINSYIKILPSVIASYRPQHDENGEEMESTVMYDKSGDETVVLLSVDEFEDLLNKFDFY